MADSALSLDAPGILTAKILRGLKRKPGSPATCVAKENVLKKEANVGKHFIVAINTLNVKTRSGVNRPENSVRSATRQWCLAQKIRSNAQIKNAREVTCQPAIKDGITTY